MSFRTSIITAGAMLALVAPTAANAAAAKSSHATSVNTPRSAKGKASAARSSSVTDWTTPAGSYVHIPATTTSPSTYVNMSACQETGACTATLDPDDGS